MSNIPGFNIHPSRLNYTQKVMLHSYTYRAKPSAHVVMNAPEFASEMRVRHPYTEVILRQLPDGGKSDNDIYDIETPHQFVERHQRIFQRIKRDDLIIYAGNEPVPPHGEKQLAWNLEVGLLCIRAGLRVVLLNAPTGNLPQSPEQKHLFDLFRPLAQLASDNPDSIYLGEHSYGSPQWHGWTPWLYGRHAFLHDYFTEQGINAGWHKTEFGFDTVHGRAKGSGTWDLIKAINWHASNGENPVAKTARTLYDIWLNVYSQRPEIKGLQIFCYGNDGSTEPNAPDNWERFNAASHPIFVDSLATLFENYRLTQPAPPPVIEPEPEPPVIIDPTPKPEPTPNEPPIDPQNKTICGWIQWIASLFCKR